MPEEALWLALVQPAVRHLSVQLGNPGLGVWLPDWDPAGDEWVFAVEAMHGALLALQPRSVSGMWPVACGRARSAASLGSTMLSSSTACLEEAAQAVG